MEEKKQIKISLKAAIIMLCVLLVVVLILIYFIFNKVKISQYDISDTISIQTYNDKDYYIIKKDYAGNYDLQFLSLSEFLNSKTDIRTSFEVKEVMNYADYKSYCNKWGIKTKYSDSSKKYIVFSYLAYGSPILEARLAGVEYNNSNVDIYMWDDASGFAADISAYVLVIPTEQNINNINIIPVYTYAEFKNIQSYDDTPYDYNPVIGIDKPIIYLYPTEDTEVSVKLLKDENLTCSYPKYKDEWKVLAQSNGNLRDLTTNRQLYSLYYESKSDIEFKVENEGFIVKGEDTIAFLEEKLAILGLTERESEEFIVYWLPKLEANKYNYIRFATTDEINETMPLEINPNPDTIIRVLMTFKGLENPLNVQEQKLETPNRTGFVAVEWGGTEID